MPGHRAGEDVTPLTHGQRRLQSAAVRHVRDAERLLQGEGLSPDQAWHLAGYGPECARKACLEEAILDKVMGHDLGAEGEILLEWWIPLDPAAWRYRLDGWASHAPILARWSPVHRYEATGTRAGEPVRELTAAAARRVLGVLADLWADGRLDEAAA